MTPEEYSLLFHRAQVNLVAFKQVFHCDDELRKMVEMAVAAEREKFCAVLRQLHDSYSLASRSNNIRARGETK